MYRERERYYTNTSPRPLPRGAPWRSEALRILFWARLEQSILVYHISRTEDILVYLRISQTECLSILIYHYKYLSILVYHYYILLS